MADDKKFMYTNDSEYVDAVINYINSPLDELSTRQFCRPLDEFRRERVDTTISASHLLDEPEDIAYQFAERVSRWIPANPSKPEIVERHNATYVHLNGRPAAVSATTVLANASQNGDYCDFDHIVTQHALIALIGQRGSGKTAFMNYWLSKNNDYLEKKNVTWFRIDVTKIYDIWKNTSIDVADLFELYNRIHTIYVVLVYGGFIQSANVKSRSGASRINNFFRRIASEFNSGAIRNSITAIDGYASRFVESKGEALSSPGADFSREFVSFTIIDRNEKILSHFDRLFSVLVGQMRKNNVTFLSIVDGLDNISWTKGNSFYVDSCKCIMGFYDSLQKRLPSLVKLILAVRPETINEIIQHNPNEVGFNSNREVVPKEGRTSQFFWCWIGVPPAKDVLSRKLVAAKESDAFEEERAKILAHVGSREVFDNNIASLMPDVSGYFDMVRDEIISSFRSKISAFADKSLKSERIFEGKRNDVLEKSAIDDDLYLRLFFDFDVRAMLDNFYKVLRVRSLSKKHGVPLFDRPERLIQYIFLNGNAFMNTDLHRNNTSSRKDFSQRGAVFPNIFWYDDSMYPQSSGNWYGLCGLRVLQTLRYRRMLAGDLISLLSECFDYPAGLIIECIESFIAFGLIEVKPPRNENNVPFALPSTKECDIACEYKAEMKITDKSILYLDYIWSRPDIMYYYALDTPIGVGFVSDKRVVIINRDFEDLRSLEDFFVASVPTVSVLFRHIMHFHSVEIARLKTRIETSTNGLSTMLKPLDAYIEYLSIPSHWKENLEATVLRGVSARRHETKDRAEKLKKNIEGVLSYI